MSAFGLPGGVGAGDLRQLDRVGSSTLQLEITTRCDRCYGEGRIGFFGIRTSHRCPTCNGTGHVAPHPASQPRVYALREQPDDQPEEGAR